MKQIKQIEGKEIYMKATKNVKQKKQFFPSEAENVFFSFEMRKVKQNDAKKTYLEAKLNKKKQRNEFFIAYVLKKEAKWIPLCFILLETGAPGLICADCWSSSIAYSLHKQGSCWLTRILTPSRIYLIDTGYEGHALPHPIHQATYFSLVGVMSLGSASR